MATLQTTATRPGGDSHADGKAYFETNTNKMLVWDATAGTWIELDSDGTGAVPFENRWGASFDGGGDILNCGNISAINSASNVTISCWIKADSFPHSTFNSIWGGGQAGGHASRFWLNANSSRLNIYNGSTQNFSFSTTVSTGTWYHTAVVISGSSNLSVYLNGSQLGSTVTTFNSLTSQSGDNFQIAGNPTYVPYFWDGLIDEVAVWDSALSSQDISKIYNGTAPNGVPTSLTSAASYDTDRTSNLKGYWRMGDHSNDSATSGDGIATITDSSGNGNGATQSDVTKQPTFKALDQSTTSLDFGANNYLDCGGASDFSFTDGNGNDLPFSVSAWVKLDKTSTQRILSKDLSTNSREYLFGTNGVNRFNMLLGTGSKNLDIGSTTTLNTTEWFHVVATYDGSKNASGLKLYVNGDDSNRVDGSVGSYTGMTATAGALEIGRFANGHSDFEGKLDEIAIFNSELTASDVSSLAASRGAHIVNDLSLSPVAYYRMGEDDSLTDGASASQISDASGNGNHATQSDTTSQPTASVEPIIYA